MMCHIQHKYDITCGINTGVWYAITEIFHRICHCCINMNIEKCYRCCEHYLQSDVSFENYLFLNVVLEI